MSERVPLRTRIDKTSVCNTGDNCAYILHNLGLLGNNPYRSYLSIAYMSRVFMELKIWSDIPYLQHPERCYDSYANENIDDDDAIPNIYCNAAMRVLATEFIEKTNFDAVLECVDSSLTESFSDCNLTHLEVYSVIYTLLCIRNEIQKADYSRRPIDYNPIHTFHKKMYYPFSEDKKLMEVDWCDIYNVFQAELCCLFSDIALDLFSLAAFGKCIREEKPDYSSEYIFNSDDIDYLNNLPGLTCLTTENGNHFFNNLLLRVIRSFNLLNSMLRQTTNTDMHFSEIPELLRQNEGNERKLSVALLQLFFKKLISLENYVIIL